MKFLSPIELESKPVYENNPVRLGDARPAVLTSAQLAAYEDPVGSGKYPELADKWVIVSDDKTHHDAMTTIVPDYANTETESKITVVDGSWTTLHTGFVRIEAQVKATQDNFGIYAGVGTNYANSVIKGLALTGQFAKINGVFPVAAGDTVWIRRNTYTDASTITVSCQFIPPKFIGMDPGTPGSSESVWTSIALSATDRTAGVVLDPTFPLTVGHNKNLRLIRLFGVVNYTNTGATNTNLVIGTLNLADLTFPSGIPVSAVNPLDIISGPVQIIQYGSTDLGSGYTSSTRKTLMCDINHSTSKLVVVPDPMSMITPDSNVVPNNIKIYFNNILNY